LEVNVKLEGNISIPGHEIPKQRISDLLCCAFEGGSNYWYWINRFNYPDEKILKLEYPHLELPLIEGGSLLIDAQGDKEHSGKLLNLESIQKGLQLLHDNYCNHFNDLLTENDDADTGDVFLQLCLFGEVVFC
jgi:hypothetical protein